MADLAVSGTPLVHGCVASDGTGGIAKCKPQETFHHQLRPEESFSSPSHPSPPQSSSLMSHTPLRKSSPSPTNSITTVSANDPIYARIEGVPPPILRIPVEGLSNPNPNPNPNPSGSGADQARCRLGVPGACGSSCKRKAYDNMQQCENALRLCKPDPGAPGATCVLGTGRNIAPRRRKGLAR